MDKNFERELRIINKLEHPNIIKVFDYEELPNKFLILMEYCSMSLQEFINETVYPIYPHIIKKIIFQILQGLNYLHSNGILHRDIKPLNILLSENGLIKICDFGCAVENSGIIFFYNILYI